jgi:hypothetical protein
LFNSGSYAMFQMGRYALIQLRQFGDLDLSVSRLPHGGYPNAWAETRGAVVYAGSRHKDLAVLFLAYLASEDYNMQIVADADAHPPNPVYADTPEFKRPAAHPNEWGLHERFSQTLRSISIPSTFSRFVLPRVAIRIMDKQREEFEVGRITAEEAARRTGEGIAAEIRRRLREEPGLRPSYDKLLKRQERIDRMVAVRREIDRLTAAGEPVPRDLSDRAEKIPIDWLSNAFYRRYYADKGWAE